MIAHLKDFDLAGGRVDVLCVLSIFSQGKCVNLDPEGDALLPAMFPGSELCADAVHLQTEIHSFAKNDFCTWCRNSEVHLPECTREETMRVWERRRVCACYLHKNRSPFVHVPQELCGVELRGMRLWFHNAHWHGDIWRAYTKIDSIFETKKYHSRDHQRKHVVSSIITDVKETVTGTIPLPALQLLVLCVLQSTVVKYHSHCALNAGAHTH